MARIVPGPLRRGHVNFQSRRLFLTSRLQFFGKTALGVGNEQSPSFILPAEMGTELAATV